MPSIHVCSLERLYETARGVKAACVITLLKPGREVPSPEGVSAEAHLKRHFSDIAEPRPGEILPEMADIEAILEFAGRWDQARPMVIHCYAGVSRSTACAYLVACALRPGRCEHEWARGIRAASPTAWPNRRLVALADQRLGRRGRMIEAIEAIGPGEPCYEGIPFALPIRAPGA
jgi:predicted protein tyrosine phosphatase